MSETAGSTPRGQASDQNQPWTAPAPAWPTASPSASVQTTTQMPGPSSTAQMRGPSSTAQMPIPAGSTGLPAANLPPSQSSPGWTPVGHRPTAPPAAAAPTRPPTAGPFGSPGGAGGSRAGVQYLPPVAPPGQGDQAPATAPEPRRGGWGWRALVAFLAGGLIAAAGFGAGFVALDERTSADDSEAAGSDQGADDEAGPTPSTARPPVRGTEPPADEPPSDVEPAAFVAQVLGPAVVKLETRLGLGSGVIYDNNLILTNNHVIEGATNVEVILSTGRVFDGTVIGSDPATDIAVVQVDTDEVLPQAELATGEKAQVGQLAIAIGAPFDLQQSVTQGIVSAVDRPIPNSDTSVVAMIQTDAPINPGNSGGALADRFGRVIGINTSIQTDGFSATNAGVGFAVPIDTAVRVADLLAAGQPIEPGFLGVRGEEPANGEVGLVLTEITPGSAAEDAGLMIGDRVLSLNGAPITAMLELAGLVLANQAGDIVVLEVVRDGEAIEIEVTLGVREG